MKKIFYWMAFTLVIFTGLHLADVYTPGELLSVLGGVQLYDDKRYEESIAVYNKVLSKRPNDVLFLNNRGVSFEALGQYKAAIADYDKAISLDPDDGYAYRRRSAVYREIVAINKAKRDCDKALAIIVTPINCY